ncbi:MAG: hypothetical protein HY691_09030 [Chloroflexi bacterium]|nr:hypothetical protein [Chloroflexota bacterium]
MEIRRPQFVLFGAALAALLSLLPLFPGQVLAHERRPIAGKYQLVVGFLNEPAFAGQMNGIDLRVTVPAEGDKPIEGLEKTLKATVIVGGGARTMEVRLEPRFRQPGAYAGYFMPTREGSYIFQFTGTIDGTAINETFESGPGRFNDVQALQPLQFPERLPDPAAIASELRTAREEAAGARTLALGGVAAGVLGLLAGLVALVTRPRPTGAVARRPGAEESHG